MSRKSSKKQDDRKTATSAKRLKNSWGKGRQSSPHIRIRPIRLLIVTEGSKTEPLYFTAFRDRINQSYGREYITVDQGKEINAERLEKKNAGLSPANCNPGTTIHQLVKDLLPYIRSENDVIDHE